MKKTTLLAVLVIVLMTLSILGPFVSKGNNTSWAYRGYLLSLGVIVGMILSQRIKFKD